MGEWIMLDAIVMDMDGTLLDPNNKILPETKAALIACQKQGTKLVLASGRSYTPVFRGLHHECLEAILRKS